MSPRPIENDTVTPSGSEAEVLSCGDVARIHFPSASQREIESAVPETSGTNDKTLLDEEAVCPSTKLNKGKNVGPEQERPTSDVANSPPIAPKDISSQAMRRGRAIRSSSATARRARRASPYDVEDIRLQLVDTSIDISTMTSPWIKIRRRSSRTSSTDSAQVGQEPTMSIPSPRPRSTGDEFLEKGSSGVIPQLAPHTAVQKKTDLEEALRRRWDDNYPKAVTKVFSSEGKLLDLDHHGMAHETKRGLPGQTPKFELSSASQTAFVADPVETLDTTNPPHHPAADQTHGVEGTLMRATYKEPLPQFLCQDPDLPPASYRCGKPPPEAAEHAPGRLSNTEADTSRAIPDTGRFGKLIVHEPIDPKYCFRPGLRYRPIFGSFPDDSPQERTDTERTHAAVDEGNAGRNARPGVKASFDGELSRIIGKIEMLEIMIDYLRNQTDTMALRMKQLERRFG